MVTLSPALPSKEKSWQVGHRLRVWPKFPGGNEGWGKLEHLKDRETLRKSPKGWNGLVWPEAEYPGDRKRP